MYSSEKKQRIEEITMLELVQAVMKRWKLILTSCVLAASFSYAYLNFFSSKNYSVSGTLIVNMEQEHFPTYFGDYTLLSKSFDDYLPMFFDERLIDKTISDLNLKDISTISFESALACDINTEELQKGYKISFTSRLPNPAQVLNTHVKNFIDYLNFYQFPHIIDYFENKKSLNREITARSMELMNDRIAYTDSLLKTLKKYNTTFGDVNQLKQSNVILTTKDLFNENYILLEKRFIDYKSKLFEYEKSQIQDAELLDSLSQLKGKFLNELNDYDQVFKVFNQIIHPIIPQTEPLHPDATGALKRSLYATGMVFFMLIFFFTFIAMIRKEKEHA